MPTAAPHLLSTRLVLVLTLAACGGSARPQARPAAAPSETASHESGGAGATFGPSADPRSGAPRGRARLEEEIRELEALLRLSAKAAERPTLLRRVAEDFVELAAALGSDPSAARAHELATVAYVKLLTEHPDYEQKDDVTYYLAYEYQRAGRNEEARVTYEKVASSPKWATTAHLALGELAFDDAAKDSSRWAEAERQYTEVVKARPPENPLYGYAWYKLAWVYWNEDDGPSCLAAFQQAIDFGTRFPQTPSAAKLTEAARHDLDAAREKFGGP